VSALEYAVKAETLEGNVMILRRGFISEEDANDHPVKIALWRRVWVEPIGLAPQAKPEPTLPPFPWDWVAAGSVDARGSYHAYLVDATGRKIAAVWGKDGEKKLIADYIVASVNAPPMRARRGMGSDGIHA
jgi:hypothetical protein